MSYYQHTISYFPIIIIIGLLNASIVYLFQLMDWVFHTPVSFLLACATMPLCVVCIINWIRVFIQAKGKRRLYNNKVDYIHFASRMTGLLFVLSLTIDYWSDIIEQETTLHAYGAVIGILVLLVSNVFSFTRDFKKRRIAKS
ncbi:hypothetical protein C5745_00685 [Sphingobacterium haloxyli]|uniref:Uncharacterized protein n=1 Tax=Sphingobacterium haloxyli TaxID=2100533 RepID=A0A2S9J8X8_9SPHI|nr:hypothetical protein C5745_00685 [Sphingobacterium haloxyli]